MEALPVMARVLQVVVVQDNKDLLPTICLEHRAEQG
jgi:hypothetical protein